MPLFSLHCKTCGRDFEAFLRFSEVREKARCPECGSAQVENPSKQAAHPTPDPCSPDKKT